MVQYEYIGFQYISYFYKYSIYYIINKTMILSIDIRCYFPFSLYFNPLYICKRGARRDILFARSLAAAEFTVN